MANVHHATRKAADKDLSEGRITEQSHAAVLAGQMDLHTARNIGVDAGSADTAQAPEVQDDATEGQERPAEDAPQDASTGPRLTSRISKNDRLSACLCGCGKLVKGRFAAGHDMRLVTYAKEYVRGERDLSKEQLEYVTTSGKLDRAKAQVEKEEQRQREKERRKAERKEKK